MEVVRYLAANPIFTITNPKDAMTFEAGETISFRANALGAVGGGISGDLVWLGVGQDFSVQELHLPGRICQHAIMKLLHRMYLTSMKK